VLADLSTEDLVWAPTFAFLDPDGMELHWSTIEALAAHKRDSKYKVELWVLFNTPGLMRVLTRDRRRLHPHHRDLATRLLGSERWSAIQDLRIDNEIEPADAREEFVNLFRWQLENYLGYRWTHPLEIKNMRGHPLYYMVFATDNHAGNKIMADLYNDAAIAVVSVVACCGLRICGAGGVHGRRPCTTWV
jgi:three-Cys-motif partner protein